MPTFYRPLFILIAASLAEAAGAHSFGSPRCEINSLPVTEMSATLADPAPSGWQISNPEGAAWPGRAMTIRVTHPTR